jgi:polyhydroxyalkanoate synthase
LLEPVRIDPETEAMRPSPAARRRSTPSTAARPSRAPTPPAAAGRSATDLLDRLAETVDPAVHAGVARLAGGLSPAALAIADLDWAVHLGFSPGKQAELVGKAWRKGARISGQAFAWPTRASAGLPASNRCRKTSASRNPNGKPGPTT